MQKCEGLEEPRKEKLKEKLLLEKEEEVPEKVKYEKRQDVPIKGLKSVFLGVKTPNLRGISKPICISHPCILDKFL